MFLVLFSTAPNLYAKGFEPLIYGQKGNFHSYKMAKCYKECPVSGSCLNYVLFVLFSEQLLIYDKFIKTNIFKCIFEGY